MEKNDFEYDENQSIGDGGFGSVYCGKWISRNITVAIKDVAVSHLKPMELKRFRNEVAALHAIQHPCLWLRRTR